MVAFLENLPFPFNTCVGQELWRTLVSNACLQTIFVTYRLYFLEAMRDRVCYTESLTEE